jgi:hypothetical protein
MANPTDVTVFHRRAVKYLIDMEHIEAATLLLNVNVSAEVDEGFDEFGQSIDVTVGFALVVPGHIYKILSVPENELITVITSAFSFAVSLDNESYETEQYPRRYEARVSVKLQFQDFVSKDWRQEAKQQLNAMSKFSNHAIDYWNSGVIVWNDLRFRSTEEIMIAEELEKAGVMFLPNCKTRCGLPENRKSIEADFVVYYRGRLGVLEIDGAQHNGQLAKEQDRDRFFLHSGASIVQRYTTERCRKDAKGVVLDFLRILSTRE